jgi:type I restriction enzyme S subunit
LTSDEKSPMGLNKTNINWKKLKLGEILSFRNGKSSAKDKGKEGGEYPVYGANGVIAKTDDVLEEEPVIIVGRVGAYCGNVQRTEDKSWATDNTMIVRAEDADIDFTYYLLSNLNLNKYRTGTSQPLLTQTAIKDIETEIPPRREQKKIGKMLRNIDEKILTNNEINNILEEMSRAIFRSRFVEFEPYEEFKSSELGNIPEEFEVKNLVDIADVTYGYSFSSDEFNEDSKGVPVIRIRNLPDNETDQYSTEEFNEKYLVESGDILAGMDGEFRPYIWKGPQAGLNQRVCKFEGVKPQYSEIYLWNVVRRPLFKLEQAKTGTTVIHLGKGDIDQLRIPIPDDQSLEEFNEILNPLYEEMINRVKENRMLEELRDTLLPKLMSGEIRVDDIESDELEVDSEV